MVDDPNRQRPIPEDMEFQYRNWAVERIAWVAMMVWVLLGLAGTFASGPASNASVTSTDGAVAVDYQRFARNTARSHFLIRVATVSSEAARIRFSPSLIAFYDIEAMEPRALRERAGRAGLEMDFAASAAGDLVVDIAARAKRFGITTVAVDVENHAGVKFRQIVYP